MGINWPVLDGYFIFLTVWGIFFMKILEFQGMY